MVCRIGITRRFGHLVSAVGLCGFLCSAAPSAEVTARIDRYEGPATITLERLERHKVKIVVDPKTERNSLTLYVELPVTGPQAWPAVDVEVLDGKGRPVSVRRSGIEWNKLWIRVPPAPGEYVVHAVESAASRVAFPSEAERQIVDAQSGLRLRIAKWYNGRKAALSLRFDDSHPSHLFKVIPLLRQYGYRGTFMVNPGAPDFQNHRAEWEACAKRGDQEFANHTMHHRGAIGDEQMESEIGEATKAIRALCPQKSKLLALNLGGGTYWETTKTLRYYLDKYHLFDASVGSTGMDDVYGDRVGTFRRMLKQHIERGLWFRVHYHSIGEGLTTSEVNFRTVLDIIKQHESHLWIAGMADIHKYQTERGGVQLTLVNSDAGRFMFKLSCFTDCELYDQPLTIEAMLPPSSPYKRVVVKDGVGRSLAVRPAQQENEAALRFEVKPCEAIYFVELAK